MEKIIETSECKNCKNNFHITDWDMNFYKKMEVPLPTFCANCRQMRRLAFRNERYLYHRKCDLCQKNIISVSPPDTKLKVYCVDCFWSDKWNETDYGIDFDFSKNFFEQYALLKARVPHLALYGRDNFNSDFVNLSGYNKNCYLIFAGEYNEDCQYGTQVIKCKDCLDNFDCFESQNCYECIDISKCYEVFFSENCRNCNSSMFLFDCRGCAECLFCTNLRNKKYCIQNHQYSKEEYLKYKQTLIEMLKQGQIEAISEKFEKLKKSAVYKNLWSENNENSEGNYLFDSKNCLDCYDLSYGEDCKFVYTGFKTKDCMDVCHTTEAEMSYEGTSIGYHSYNVKFMFMSWTSSNCEYGYQCANCTDAFGCVGLKHKKYCILNKQYTKDEYQNLRQKIIEHMKKTKEYGEFFPINLSQYCYNETLANDYFPLKKEEALSLGYNWKDKENKEYLPQKFEIPKNIEDVKEEIINEILSCKTCGRNFKLNFKELNFHKRFSLPISHFCPDCRQLNKLGKRPKRNLIQRECAKCGTGIKSAITDSSINKIYCEKCYLAGI